jgi:hypothetical protein
MDAFAPLPAEGSFTRAVQRGKVKGPQQRGFTLENWEKALIEYCSGAADRVLYLSGVWFYTHFAQVRASTDEYLRLAELSSPLSLKAVIAAANM